MMGTQEPTIRVGIIQGRREIRGRLDGPFTVAGQLWKHTSFHARAEGGGVVLYDGWGGRIVAAERIPVRAVGNGTFILDGVTIGISFHWERNQTQSFLGDLVVEAEEGGLLRAVNEVPAEAYLASVVASEMNSAAPPEFLKVHAVVARSWLMALLKRGKRIMPDDRREGEDEIVRWYDRDDHRYFDVCGDDHCQRYQGVQRDPLGAAAAAVRETRGLVLCWGDEICDARYHKACGGITEDFSNVWSPLAVSYLTSVSDGPVPFAPVRSEDECRTWVLSRPDAYCRIEDPGLLKEILPDFDRETVDFYRWRVEYTREELQEILFDKAGVDFGTLLDIIPLMRGPSGRVTRLRIVGSQRTVNVGKELEIRRWLSRTHLQSSAFVVTVRRGPGDVPERFTFFGAGWGHGVGLCQIGAAAMAARGRRAETILTHYFRGAQLCRLYP